VMDKGTSQVMDLEEKAFRHVLLPEVGWVLVATRDLPPLATVMQESPAVVAPDPAQPGALHPLLSLVSHSCVSNTTYSVNPEDFSVTLRTRKNILEGEEIRVCHISPIYGHPRRREKLKEKGIFNCRCPRCLDVTEFGTLTSAVRCGDCREGLILPVSGEEGALWRCRFCSNPFEPEMIATLVQKLENNLATICSNSPTVKLLEAFMRKNSKDLYIKHYVNLLAQKHIIDLLSEEENLTRELATKTIRHCKAFKSLMGRLDPGLSGWLYQVERTRCRAQGELAKWDLREQKIDKKTFVEESEAIWKSLQDVNNCKIINDASDVIK